MAKKKIRKNIGKAIAHVNATFNNTLITITDLNGETLARTCRHRGFNEPGRRPRSQPPGAASRVASKVKHGSPGGRGPRQAPRFRSRVGHHRSQCVGTAGDRGRGPHADLHNGCRPRKQRRV